MATGPDGQLYIATDSGLAILNHGRTRTFGKREGVDESRVMVVLPVGPDDAWFGTSSGHLYHYHDKSIMEIGAHFLSREPIYGLAMAPDRTIWVGTGAGLFALRGGTLDRYKPRIPLPIVAIYDLALSPEGGLFAATDGGLFEIDRDDWKSWTTRNGLPSNELNVLAMDSTGTLWIGTTKGAARFANGTVQRLRNVTCSVHFLFVDHEKSLWVGCDESRGLIRITASPVSFLYVPSASDPASISSLVEDKSGAVWIGSSQGLFRYESGRLKRYTRRDGLPSEKINGISLSSAGRVWVATGDGLAVLGNSRFRSFRTTTAGPLEPFYWVFEDRERTVWATTDRGLIRRNVGETAFHDVPESANSMESIQEDREGALWVASASEGITRFTGSSKTSFTTACGLRSNRVYSSTQDNTGAIWALTSRGLGRIKSDRCATIEPSDGLPVGRPGSITFDGRGHLWMRTQDGIAAIDSAEANYVIDHGGSIRNTRYFGRDDGFGEVLGDSPFWLPMFVHSSGAIWFSTSSGVAIFNPSVLQTPPLRLRPQVTSVATDSGEHILAAPIKIQPGDLHLQFAYGAPYLLGAKNREYRYRLIGFDSDWRDAGKSREAVYISLPPGKYFFQVTARLPFEPWSEPSTSIEVIVFPYFYQTWWWYALLTLAASTAIVLGYHIRITAVRRQDALIAAERSRERSRLARELHDTLSQGMMSIHAQIESARTLIRSKPDSACSHLETAVSIIRDSASETRRYIAALRSEIDANATLRDMLNRTISKFRQSSQIPLEALIDDELPMVGEDVSYEIARVADEALANVRLHSDAEQAHLFACMSGELLVVEVRDNGRGFDMPSVGRAYPGHFGLTGMTERAQRIHGTLIAKSIPGEGTRIVLEVPVTVKPRSQTSQSIQASH